MQIYILIIFTRNIIVCSKLIIDKNHKIEATICIIRKLERRKPGQDLSFLILTKPTLAPVIIIKCDFLTSYPGLLFEELNNIKP